MQLLLSANSIDITPQSPTALFGFAERHGVYSQVHDNLEINLSALKQGDQLILIYSVDTLFVPVELEQLVLDKFGKEYKLLSANIWMTATHTHFAPSLDREKPGLGEFDEAYYSLVVGKLLELTEQVLQSPFKEVSIKHGTTQSKLNVNRRKKLLRPKEKFGIYNKVLMYPDHDGVKDDVIHVLNLVNEEGTTEMVLWNYACHPVGFVHRSQVTAEFIGIIRGRLRSHFNNDKLPVVFLLGFAGNLKPDITAVTHTKLKDRIRYFFQLGAKYTKFPRTPYYMKWTELLWEEVKGALDNATAETTAELSCSQVNMPLRELIGEYDYKVHLKKIRLANEVQLLGVSAEVLAEYKDIVTKALQSESLMCVGCLAGTRIYLPTDKNVREGGYEVHWFQHRFAIEGEFKEGLDNKIRDAVSKL